MAERSLDKEMDLLKDELGKIKKDLGGLVDSIKSVSKSGAKATRSSVETEFEKAFSDFQERSQQYVASTEKGITDRPFGSVAVAFGVGLLVGKLLDR